jgi:NhaA family Na+:H+ antiporter
LEKFLAVEASSGIILLVATVVALAWSNSPWRASYLALLHVPIGFRFGSLSLERDLHFWINDGLMSLFLFVVGLEIKRELHSGHLSDARRAALPVFAAIGGMIAPAAIFLAFSAGTAAARGWGIPMATDIAFAVGVLGLLGRRVPSPVRILLLALAVVDDLGAILVIAFFYSEPINMTGVAVAIAGMAFIVLLQKSGVRSPWSYVAPALATWGGACVAGVHPTIAGVAIGLVTPVRVRVADTDGTPPEVISPAERVQNALHRWVAFGIMPIFAFANAGVSFGGLALSAPERRVVIGVVLGLVLGKPIGVISFAWLAVRVRLAALPPAARWSSILVVGLVAGVGFTMALFISSLAFGSGSLNDAAKLGILAASTVAAAASLALGRLLLRARPLAQRQEESTVNRSSAG